MYGKNVNLKKKCHCKKICAAARCLCKITGTQCKVECRCKGTAPYHQLAFWKKVSTIPIRCWIRMASLRPRPLSLIHIKQNGKAELPKVSATSPFFG
ncbi:Protein tesmin/TSO1-like CXC 2 [Frankliniella fusca]|uniref:Protein tesmin/TSO1-like CXC 2 n=1 Tax=Frankliniella fusca TaxID=407009 RepID=A0AAE1H2G1_9NEOP|nr:Protein tesmin/TSO1-like CXC 2 [Frankliniella fusca]